MYRLKPVQFNQQLVATPGTDKVIAVFPVPEGGVFQGCKFLIHAISQTKSNVLQNLSGYALSAYMFPILDPDTAWDPDTVWDQQLPKDDQFAANDLDLDTTGTDTTPDIDWGDANPSLLAGQAGFPSPLYKASRLISFANSKGGFEIDGVSASNDGYIPTDIWSRSITRSKSAPVHSAVMFGLSSYNFPTPKTAFNLPDSDGDWDILRYADDYQADARKSLVGLTETGAESPYEDALTQLNLYIEHNYESSPTYFHPASWNVFIQIAAIVDVPGQFSTPALVSGQPLA